MQTFKVAYHFKALAHPSSLQDYPKVDIYIRTALRGSGPTWEIVMEATFHDHINRRTLQELPRELAFSKQRAVGQGLTPAWEIEGKGK